jgi:hypothetical protein
MSYNNLRLSLLFILVAAAALPPKMYLIGGASFQTEALVFQQLAKLVPERTPQPQKCD